MMSFGTVAVDADRPTALFPTASMLTGLLGNALGYDHREFGALQSLQDRLSYGALGTVGTPLVDYQTVDLGQPFMLASKVGWTTAGIIEERAGGPAKTATHIRTRHYLTGAKYWVAIALENRDGPDESQCFDALRFPARPLFLGRKCCLPTRPVAESLETGGVLDVLTPRATPGSLLWIQDDPPDGWVERRRWRVRNRRDWHNQIHVGERRWTECQQEVA